LRLQQELPVNCLQVQIVHAKHGARRLGRHFTGHWTLQRDLNV
jgi:hypothetical protein